MKKLKLLYILNTAKKVNSFSYTSMVAAQELGIEFHIAGNWAYASEEERMADEKQLGIKIHQIDFIRTPYHPKNKRAYAQLKELCLREEYDAIHCNTPIGGLLGRIVGKQCKVKKVIYQVHGFHFYKGAPKLNWMLYYPIEKWLTRYTDTIITINQEDYEFAQTKLKLRNNGEVYYVHGVGINTSEYSPDDEIRRNKRMALGFSDDCFYIVSAGRLEQNKNNATLIRAVANTNNKSLRLVLCGEGQQKEELKALSIKLGIEEQIIFLGNRSDMNEIYLAVDAFAMASFREGLSRTIMEAMSSGLPCVVSKIRGNVDLIEDQKGGYLYSPNDYIGYSKAFNELFYNPVVRENMKKHNLERIKLYDVGVVKKELVDIYTNTLN